MCAFPDDESLPCALSPGGGMYSYWYNYLVNKDLSANETVPYGRNQESGFIFI